MRSQRKLKHLLCCCVLIAILIPPALACAEDATQLSLTLPSGAKIDAELVGTFPEALPVYRARAKQFDVQQMIDTFSQDPQSLVQVKDTYLISESELFTTPKAGPYNRGGTMAFFSLWFRSVTEYMFHSYPVYFDDASAYYNRACNFMSRENAIQHMKQTIMQFMDNMQIEPLQLLALRADDLRTMQQALWEHAEFKRMLPDQPYEKIDPVTQEHEIYWAHFKLYLNGIPLLGDSDTYNYPGVPSPNTFIPSHCWIGLMPRGYMEVRVEGAVDFISESEPQQLLTLDEILKVYDAFMDNNGDYRYPKTIHRIYLEYIPVNIDWENNCDRDLRPFWCFSEEKAQSTGDSTRNLSDCAYRFDAITGELLPSGIWPEQE